MGDDSGSYALAARFDGLQACGPGSDESGEDYLVQFFPGAWGEFEWECVELSMRWMYLAWGVEPYAANGNGVVANYPDGTAGWPHLQKISNGTRAASPKPGDVLSIANSDAFGHTEVVTATSVDSQGNGTLTAITENDGAGSNGWATLTVQGWTVSDGVAGDTVLGWLHNPAWSLQQPVLDRISGGVLQVQASGGLDGTWVTIASGIARAQVIGGDGWEPEPIIVALTTSGRLEFEYYLPGIAGRALSPIASNVTSFAVAASVGAHGEPSIGWVTAAGDFELAAGSLTAKPALEATGVQAIALAPDTGTNGLLVGYLSEAGTFFDKMAPAGSLATSPWFRVASGVTQIALAGGTAGAKSDLRAYVQGGTFYLATGLKAPFSALATGAAQVAVTSVGTTDVPLLAYVTAGGALETEVDEGPAPSFSQQATGVASASVAAGPTGVGFASIAWLTTTGDLYAAEGLLGGTPGAEGTAVSQGGIAALTVS